jgi:hypothetical protein
MVIWSQRSIIEKKGLVNLHACQYHSIEDKKIKINQHEGNHWDFIPEYRKFYGVAFSCKKAGTLQAITKQFGLEALQLNAG